MNDPINPPSIVAPEISEAEIVQRWDVASGREERAEKTLAEVRLEKGRILVAARKMFPRTGNDGAWSKLLAKLRVDPRTALRYMNLAGFVAASDKVSEAVPTYAEAGVTKAAEAADSAPPAEPTPNTPPACAAPEPAGEETATTAADDWSELASINLGRTFWPELTELLRRKTADGLGPATPLHAFREYLGASVEDAVASFHAAWLCELEELRYRLRLARAARQKDARTWTERERFRRWFDGRPSPELDVAYRTLGLTAPSTPEQVKSQHRYLAKRFHPDLGGSEASTERMGAINRARDAVMDHLEGAR